MIRSQLGFTRLKAKQARRFVPFLVHAVVVIAAVQAFPVAAQASAPPRSVALRKPPALSLMGAAWIDRADVHA